ncbi:DUF2857 domain-containing protein [Pseudomonas cichorii]|nr:DUF2857 domain-containing protein [Pseudomonas cichorii]
MAKKHNPLNEAVINQVLHNLRNGEIRRCLDMGLDPEILSLLQSPASLSVLLNAQVIWCQVAVDPEMVKRLLSTRERSDEETRIMQRALRLGATTPMLQDFFGMSPQDVSLQRVLVGVPGKPGRFRDLPDDTPIWHRFCHLMAENGTDYKDSVATLDIAMLIAEEINAPLESDKERISLGLIWSKIQSWIAEGLYPVAPVRKQSGVRSLKSLGKVEGDSM